MRKGCAWSKFARNASPLRSRRSKSLLATAPAKKQKAQMTKSNSSEISRISEPATTTKPRRLLDGIRSPADIKALREQDLPQLAQEVRDELIRVLSQTGGH